ncbi:hypothetical protein IQ266_00600 [filamentous cyanobacterium LEGE 11480]|uniref:Uncharacterized protein n=1 Tax=Romeriopsis navalis LEGE 11480 TaxID=2777977 RepID=A0A928VI85_9CYAN|nr:hypothetical protein [Romeriopsis navalis]MBE9028253.1 hypothetical protein [Romeriopsis navalis LEGE 11480]
MKIRLTAVLLAGVGLLSLLAMMPAHARLTKKSKLYLDGLGPIQAGMTVAEAERAIGQQLMNPDLSGERLDMRCYYLPAPNTPPNGSASLNFMVYPAGDRIDRYRDRIVRVGIDRGSSITTLSGAAIGSTEAEIMAMYPGRIKVTRHHYTGDQGGKYLTYVPRAAANKKYSLVFETLNGKVTSFRSGLADAVSRIEGCS